MTTDNTCPTLIEHLSFEIFLQIFSSLSLEETVITFSGLNSYIDLIIRSINDGIHTVSYNDTNDADLLYLYPAQIGRLIITLSSDVDFTSLINLRSLTIKYGTFIQFDRIRPQYFYMLELLHIFGGKLRKSLMKVLTVDLIINSELMFNYYFRSL